MSFIDHPIAQKVLAGLVIAGATAVGGFTLATRDTVREHELKLNSVLEMRQDLKTIQTDVGEIKTDVAVLKERVKNDAKREAEPVR